MYSIFTQYENTLTTDNEYVHLAYLKKENQNM